MMFIKPVHAVGIADYWAPAKTAQFQSLGGMVSYFLPKALLVAGIIFFILVIIAGFGMIASGGSEDAQAKEKAKSYLTYAVVGLIIVFSSYWILGIINYVTSGSLDALMTP